MSGHHARETIVMMRAQGLSDAQIAKQLKDVLDCPTESPDDEAYTDAWLQAALDQLRAEPKP
jgi:hypothetical protein